MPLPPALAAKLAKRGIVGGSKSSTTSTPGFIEEIIEENYDEEVPEKSSALSKPRTKVLSEYDQGKKPSADNKEASRFGDFSTSVALPMTKFHRQGHFGCPNKTNIYHKCSQYCVSRWGRGKKNPNPIYNGRRLKMLKKYPLPSGWVEIYDPGSGQYYYWEISTDTVCWRSPRHPRAKLLRPASELRLKAIEGKDLKEKDIPRHHRAERDRDRYNRDRDRQRDRDIERRSDREEDREMSRENVLQQLDRYKREKEKRKRIIDDDLDPMDPAAYSNIARGTWKSGLETAETGKSAADSTAAGPLFQQRPYPNPGAILRMNTAESKKK